MANEGQHVKKRASVNQSEEEIILAPGNILKAAKNKSFFANTLRILCAYHLCLLNAPLESPFSSPRMHEFS